MPTLRNATSYLSYFGMGKFDTLSRFTKELKNAKLIFLTPHILESSIVLLTQNIYNFITYWQKTMVTLFIYYQCSVNQPRYVVYQRTIVNVKYNNRSRSTIICYTTINCSFTEGLTSILHH
jgi:hypothetical protein